MFNRTSLLAALACAPTFAQVAPPPPPPVRAVGTDVTTYTITDCFLYNTQTVDGVVVHGFGVGTDAWNIGDRPMPWWNTGADVSDHPVIVQSLYRAVGPRLEQVAISWGKHGTVPANSNSHQELGACASSGLPSRTLGVNCSDIYGSGLNAGQGLLGPRFDVDPLTGAYTYPFTPLVGTYTSSTQPAARRAQVAVTDINPASNPGAVYYAEAQFIHPEDAMWNNGRNNFSSRRIAPLTAYPPASPSLPFATVTYPRTTALELFVGENAGAVTMRTVEYVELTATFTDKWQPWTPQSPTTPYLPQAQWTTVTTNLIARYQVAANAVDNADGSFTYTYMVLNENSHRGVSALSLRLPPDAQTTQDTFRAPKYHSGDRVLNTPWAFSKPPGAAEWRVDPSTAQVLVPGMAAPVTFEPNFLRWGTMYTYSVRVNAPPMTGSIRLTLQRPFAGPMGVAYSGDSVAVSGIPVPRVCTADVGRQGGVAPGDGVIDNNDFIVYLDAFFGNNRFIADIGAQGGLPTPDNNLDNNDFVVYVDAFFAACS